LQEKQRIAAAEGDDADVFGYHYENQMLAVNLFHMRGGKVLDRREFFWKISPNSRRSTKPIQTMERRASRPSRRRRIPPAEFFSALLKQLYLAQPYVPRTSTSPSTLKIAKS